MNDVVVDTNVPLVANNRGDEHDVACALCCVDRLSKLMKEERVVLDDSHHILDEYKKKLSSDGQPGVGDAFYLHVLRHTGDGIRTRLIQLDTHPSRGFKAFPKDTALAAFDDDDRKFAAAAVLTGAPILNAVDSDWAEHEAILRQHGIRVEFVCGKAAATRRSQ